MNNYENENQLKVDTEEIETLQNAINIDSDTIIKFKKAIAIIDGVTIAGNKFFPKDFNNISTLMDDYRVCLDCFSLLYENKIDKIGEFIVSDESPEFILNMILNNNDRSVANESTREGYYHELMSDTTEALRGKAIGLILSIANKYNHAALFVEIHQGRIKDEKFFQGKLKNFNKRIALFLSKNRDISFPKNIFYAANATRHSGEWFNTLNEYEQKNNLKIDFSNKEQLDQVFKINDYPVESIEAIRVILAKYKIDLTTGLFRDDSICLHLASALKLHNLSLMNENFRIYKNELTKLLENK